MVQIRFTDDQLELLEKAQVVYEARIGERMTRSDFVRRLLMLFCLKELGMITLPKTENFDD